MLQLVDELSGIVFLMLYVAQFLLPDTRELTALEEFLADEIDELDARRRGYQTFALPADIVALEKCLDDAGT